VDKAGGGRRAVTVEMVRRGNQRRRVLLIVRPGVVTEAAGAMVVREEMGVRVVLGDQAEPSRSLPQATCSQALAKNSECLFPAGRKESQGVPV
jgi:hypothetical protein